MSALHSHQQQDYTDLPEHVRRIIERDGEIEFTPPSFERWLGRLQMLRTITSMSAFLLVWIVTFGFGTSWEVATVRGIVAAVVFHFVAWALGLFVFGEMYDAEVKVAREELEAKDRERARRIESYYRERLRIQQEELAELDPSASQAQPATGIDDPIARAIPGYIPTDAMASAAPPTPAATPVGDATTQAA